MLTLEILLVNRLEVLSVIPLGLLFNSNSYGNFMDISLRILSEILFEIFWALAGNYFEDFIDNFFDNFFGNFLGNFGNVFKK